MRHYDVIVAGLGAMGSAAVDRLSGRGVRVLGLEPHGVPHGLGSSGGDTRLVRKAYFEHEDYVPLLERAYAGWRSLEADSGEPLLHTVGLLYLGRPDSALIDGSRRSAAAHDLVLESLSDTDLRRDHPAFRRPEGYVALFEPDAGFVLCERAVRAQVARALEHGAQIAVGERLVGWRDSGDGVEVTTDADRYSAARLVVAVGSWSGRVLEGLGMPLRVTRQPLFWVHPAAGFELGRSPCWAVQRPDAPGLYYGFPALPGNLVTQLGVKIAHHAPGEEVDPDAARRPVRLEELEALRGGIAPFVTGLEGPLTGSRVCLYTSTADGHFVVDTHPRSPNVVLACGFSGHGFKFAPVIGEALADLALEGASSLPIGFLKLR